MNDLNIIDQFLSAFSSYIDAGFGLLGGDVHRLTATLIGIDVTLAGLFWALGGEQDVIGRFVRKVLYVGAFAFILNSFSTLADIIFRSFAAIGLEAGGNTLSADDLLRPGKLAGVGFQAAWPLLEQASKMAGLSLLFDNFLEFLVLLFAWALVILAFFVLAVQLFVTILEFKLTSLAGFVLVPFALWGRTSFLAERVLGNVVSSGVKVMVLAVIVGIGSGFFVQFTTALQGQQPDIAQAMTLVLASLSLLGLGIFGPGIASGLVAGAPQLGAGAAVGTAVGVASAVAMGGGAAIGAVTMAAGGGLGAVRSGTTMGAAGSTSGTANGAGGAEAARSPTRGNAPRGTSEAATSPATTSTSGPAGTPDWARQLRAEQTARHHRQTAVQALKEGDGGGGSATPDIDEKEE
jgi:type IV secretion system protein TrbL